MSDTVIKVNNLGKRYQIGAQQKTYKTFQETLLNVLKAPAKNFRRIQNLAKKVEDSDDTIWALKDVSFEVKQGEVIGIIGKNGSGKSTLLKILSRITEPTEGSVELRGRVSSLLEVGTGFHRELTGRENIYLNGSILGMRKWEIDKKFDEIVAFSEIEKFIDTPVKHYSSGMYVRLAFAVAAHLEPEILLVDEVLAVGDAAFQKKCLGKMGDIAKEGRTVLFVSHNMGAVSNLCSSCMFLEHGKVVEFGDIPKVIHRYLTNNDASIASVNLADYKFRCGNKEIIFEWARLCNIERRACRQFSIGDDIVIVFGMKSTEKYWNKKVKVAIQIRSSDSIPLCNIVDVDSGFQIEHLHKQEVISVTIKDIRLYPDTYYISLWVGSMDSAETFDHVEDCINFEIMDGGRLAARRLPRSAGLLFFTPEWKQEDQHN